MQYTENLGLAKPDKEDFYNVEDFNDNADKIDETISLIRSHVGMIVQTTTLDTMEKVIDIYGGKKWVRIEGRLLIGASDDYAAGSVGGSATHKHTNSSTGSTILSEKQIPSHSHSIPALSGNSSAVGHHSHYVGGLSGTTNAAGSHTHTVRGFANVDDLNFSGTGDCFAAADAGYTAYNQIVNESGNHSHTVTIGAFTVGENGGHSHTVSTNASTTGKTGSGTGHTHTMSDTGSSTSLPPYRAVYIWERTV